MQLLVSWAIVVISTLYGRSTDNCADGEDCESGESSRWIVSDSSAINALGETVFVLTVAASFLISFDSYVNAKAQANPKSALFLVNNPRCCRVLWHPPARLPCATELPPPVAGTLAPAAFVRGHTGIDNVGVPHARCAVRPSLP